MAERVYLDWNARAPLRAEAKAAMQAALDLVGNPSSVHSEGRAAKGLVERAREAVAEAVGCRTSDVIFTSGATEAAALAISEMATVCTSAVEHECVEIWNSAGAQAELRLDVDSQGIIQPTIGGAPFADSLWDDIVAFQAANSETGVLQDTFGLSQAVWATQRDALVLVDAVQAIGKVPFDMAGSGADFAMVSAHKLGGPPGVGALCLKLGIDVTAKLKGGGQEMGRRAGTENVIGIAGFGAAIQAAMRDLKAGIWDEVEKLRKILENGIAAASDETIFVGQTARRLPNTTCFATPGWKGETQVMAMDLAGFAISAGSACSSGKVRESRVLRAMGYDALTSRSAVRVSIGPTTSEEQIERFVDAWGAAYRKQRARAA